MISTVVLISPLSVANSRQSSSVQIAYILLLLPRGENVDFDLRSLNLSDEQWEIPPRCSLNMILKKFNSTAIICVSVFDFCSLFFLWILYASNFSRFSFILGLQFSYATRNSVTVSEILSTRSKLKGIHLVRRVLISPRIRYESSFSGYLNDVYD